MAQTKRWWEVMSAKNAVHWVKNDRSGAMWPEIFPDLEVPTSNLSTKFKKARAKRNKQVRKSRRANR